MVKHLQKLLLLLAMFCIPWATQAQDVQDYVFSTGTNSSYWITLSSSASTVSGITYSDDAASSVMNIGFTFNFAGNNYTQWSCNTNGRIRLGSTAVSSGYSCPFAYDMGTDVPMIAPFTGDFCTEASSNGVTYELTGTSPNRVFVIQYALDPNWSSSGSNYVQVQLFEGTNAIRFVYGSAYATTNLNEFQVGLEASLTDYLLVNPSTHTVATSTYDTYYNWPGQNRYYQFTPDVSTCPRTGNLVMDYLSSDTAIFHWHENGTATSWVLEYDTADFTPGAGNGNLVTVYDTTYTLDGLTPGQTYYVYLHADCGSGDTSVNRDMHFTVPMTAASLPFTDDFEGPQGWDFVNGTNSNAWMIGTAASNGGTHSMYISNNGTSNVYYTSSQ